MSYLADSTYMFLSEIPSVPPVTVPPSLRETIHCGHVSTLYLETLKKYLWVYIFPLILLFPEDLAIPRNSLRGSGAHLKPLFGLPSLSSQIRSRSGSLFNKDALLALSLGEKGKETLYPWGM